MMVYLCLCAALIGGLIVQSKVEVKYHKYILCGFIVTLIILGSLRWNVGYDYGYYATRYYEYANHTYDTVANIVVKYPEANYEIGWSLVNLFIRYFSPYSYKALFLVYSVVVYSLFGMTLYEQSKNCILSIFMFVFIGIYYNSFCFMRQITAAVIITYAFRYIKSDEFFKYLIFVLFAASFHISAYMMIPMYFLLKIKLNKVLFALYFVIIALCIFYWRDIVFILSKYGYGSSMSAKTDIQEQGLVIWYAIPYATMVLAGIPAYVHLSSDKMFVVYYNALLCCLLFIILGWGNAYFSRPSLYFIISGVCLLIPYLVDYYNNSFKVNKYLCLGVKIICISSMCLYQYALLVDNYNGVVPYKTYNDEALMGVNNE